MSFSWFWNVKRGLGDGHGWPVLAAGRRQRKVCWAGWAPPWLPRVESVCPSQFGTLTWKVQEPHSATRQRAFSEDAVILIYITLLLRVELNFTSLL